MNICYAFIYLMIYKPSNELAKLKKKVDLLSYRAIHPLLKERILNEEVRIL